MSRRETIEVISILNHELESRYQDNQPVELTFRGKPTMRIDSFYPLIHERYGNFRNRAPIISGSIALRAFLTAPALNNPEASFFYAGVQVENNGYGLILPNPEIVSDVAEHLGINVNFKRLY